MIDSETQRRLRERFNPDGSPLRDMQLRMLEMLKFIDRICRENGINYWLSSGSCLGAMRHGGFIPWDDDVDIEMLEPDYKRLTEVLGNGPVDGYELQTKASEPTYVNNYAKLRDLYSEIKEPFIYDDGYRLKGIFIDVFCIAPSASRRLHNLARGVHRLSLRFYGQPQLWKKIARRALDFSSRVLNPAILALGKISGTNRLRHLPGSFFPAPRERRDLLPTRYVPFEDTRLPVPADADAYLTRIYGDWQKLPPLDSIQPHVSNCLIYTRPE